MASASPRGCAPTQLRYVAQTASPFVEPRVRIPLGMGLDTFEVYARMNFVTWLVAEREGFEPSIRVTPYTNFPGWRLRPLGHLSFF